MRRLFSVVFMTVVVGATIAVAAQELVLRTDIVGQQSMLEEQIRRLQAAGPDTRSPGWHYLTNDVAIDVREDGQRGLRGRLYVRVDNMWLPVATDALVEDGVIPAR